jgi:hypothetical protein
MLEAKESINYMEMPYLFALLFSLTINLPLLGNLIKLGMQAFFLTKVEEI